MNPIRHLRESQGWTQNQLAQKVGCSRSLISMLETNQTMPTFSMFQRLSETFGVSMTSLVVQFDESSSSPQTAAAPSLP